MALEPGVILNNLDYLLWGRAPEGEIGGLLLSVIMALWAGVLSILIGAPLGVAGWLHPTLARRLLFPLADLIRAVPLLFLIFWFYFLIPLLVGGTAPGAVMVVVALTAFNTASVMYLVVAGFRALPAGQSEAAHALGFTPGQIVRRILAPQALPNILPSALGLGVMLIKDTSLAFIVNVPELTTVAGQVNGRLQVYPAEIFLTVGALYFLVCGALVLLANRFNRKRGVRR